MVKTMTTPKVPMGRRKRMENPVVDSNWVWSMMRTGWTGMRGWVELGAGLLWTTSPPMSSIALAASSMDWSADEWTEAILSLMLVRYSGRLRATLRSWRATTYPTAQMMVKARMPVIATASTRGTRRDSRRLTAGASRKESVRAKAKRIRSSRAKNRIRTVTASTRKG